VSNQAKRHKTALVLAGGGLTGAVYEIGALRAIDDLLVDRSVNDFDIYVGTSAGAIIGTGLANGMSPDEMMTLFDGSDPDMPPIRRGDIFNVNTRDIVRQAMYLPRVLGGVGGRFLLHPNETTFFDMLWSLSQALPNGLYDGMAIERYIRRLLSLKGRSNDFKELDRELHIIATDLDSGERVVFGRQYRTDVPISMAVAASCAVPALYKPVRIGDNEYVDGGLRGNASLDLAIEHGAQLVVCINPLVPFDRHRRPEAKYLAEGKSCDRYRGLQFVSSQTTRVITHAGLEYHIKQMRRQHPEVDIILIEPSAEDCTMFSENVMQYSARLAIAQHGFEAVTVDLAVEYRHYKEILARHGIPISRRLVISELKEILDSRYDPEVIRRVLEQRSAACPREERNAVVCDLDRTLAELDMVLDSMEAPEKIPLLP
jgi:predicted acylesterase/phospholipase RssA